jgi:hypothetical protein
MANTKTRPRIVRLEQLGTAAREGVALAIEERVKRFGPENAITAALAPATTGIIAPEPAGWPDPLDPFAPGTLAE